MCFNACAASNAVPVRSALLAMLGGFCGFAWLGGVDVPGSRTVSPPGAGVTAYGLWAEEEQVSAVRFIGCPVSERSD